MITPNWNVAEPSLEETAIGAPPAPMASLLFLRAAVRRRWRLWVGLAVAGLLLGSLWATARPPANEGTATLMLAHEDGTDPTQAMSTDMSLLRTRTVARKVIDELGLRLTPDQFQAAVTAEAATPTIMVLTVAGPDRDAAVRWTHTLADTFLAFRAKQIAARSAAVVAGDKARVTGLQARVDQLTTQYNALSRGSTQNQSQAADVLTMRSQLNSQISTLQQDTQNNELQNESIVTASHVLDRPSTVGRSTKKALLLGSASGLIGGTALGIGLVLFVALTSDRLRQREEVALALGIPVRFSVTQTQTGGLAGLRNRIVHRDGQRSGLEVLARGLESALPTRVKPQRRLAVGAIDNDRDAALAAGAIGVRLALSGWSVFLVDLTEAGRLQAAVTRALAEENQSPGPSAIPEVFRPEGVAYLARGPLGAAPGATVELAKGHPRRAAWDKSDVVLTLADVDPAVGVDDLVTWADRVVIVVTAGRSSAERLRTTGQLVRASGLDAPFALLVGADRTDESLGRLDLANVDEPQPEQASR